MSLELVVNEKKTERFRRSIFKLNISDSNNFQYGQESSAVKLEFNEVWNRTSDTNCTVYFGNCGEISEDFVRSLFDRYGPIVEIRVFKEKGYAFVR